MFTSLCCWPARCVQSQTPPPSTPIPQLVSVGGIQLAWPTTHPHAYLNPPLRRRHFNSSSTSSGWWLSILPRSNSFSSRRASLLSRRSCRSISSLIRRASFASSLRQHAIMDSRVILSPLYQNKPHLFPCSCSLSPSLSLSPLLSAPSFTGSFRCRNESRWGGKTEPNKRQAGPVGRQKPPHAGLQRAAERRVVAAVVAALCRAQIVAVKRSKTGYLRKLLLPCPRRLFVVVVSTLSDRFQLPPEKNKNKKTIRDES